MDLSSLWDAGMSYKDIFRRYMEERARKEMRKLEEQGKLFIRMGYEPEELTIVIMPDGSKEITPNSSIRED